MANRRLDPQFFIATHVHHDRAHRLPVPARKTYADPAKSN